MQTNDGRLIVISGKSRSGKTAWVAREVKRFNRLIAWDVEAQWCELPGWKKITTRAELFKAVQRPGPAKLAYVARGDIKAEFDFWAGCAKYWGEFFGPCAAIAEELADVTTQSKAPGNWGVMVRRGLKRGITIFAISQRWAEADKTAFNNVSEFVLFKAVGKDVAYLADRTGIPRQELEALRPEYWDEAETRLKCGPFIRANASGEIKERGALRFPKPKA